MKSKSKATKVYILVNVPNGVPYGGEWESSKRVAKKHLTIEKNNQDPDDTTMYTVILEATVSPVELKKLKAMKTLYKISRHKDDLARVKSRLVDPRQP